ncbi:MAG: class I SAM-dependent methyltransferase [Candidatus Hodarchaeota archaeon]
MSKEEAKERAKSVLNEIRDHYPNAKRILDLGTGIGVVLAYFVNSFEIHGLDIEEPYINVCRKKFPMGKFYVSSMHNFAIKKKFDVIFSTFDSINFLESFDQWESTFQRVSDHLVPDGLFIFDMYSPEILRWESVTDTSYEKISLGFALYSGTTVKNELIWECKIFEHVENNIYELHEYSWTERIFPIEDVEIELKTNFKIIKKQIFEEGRRIRFVCRKK